MMEKLNRFKFTCDFCGETIVMEQEENKESLPNGWQNIEWKENIPPKVGVGIGIMGIVLVDKRNSCCIIEGSNR